MYPELCSKEWDFCYGVNIMYDHSHVFELANICWKKDTLQTFATSVTVDFLPRKTTQ